MVAILLSISDQREGGVYNKARAFKQTRASISDQREGGVYNALFVLPSIMISISDQREGGVYNLFRFVLIIFNLILQP